jgi:hypothetical protein
MTLPVSLQWVPLTYLTTVWHRASGSETDTAEAFPGGTVKLPRHWHAWIKHKCVRAMPQRRGRVNDQSLNRYCGVYIGTGVPGCRCSVPATLSSSSPFVSTLTSGTPAFDVLNRLQHILHREIVVMIYASSVQNLIQLLCVTSPPCYLRFVFLPRSLLNAAQ